MAIILDGFISLPSFVVILISPGKMSLRDTMAEASFVSIPIPRGVKPCVYKPR